MFQRWCKLLLQAGGDARDGMNLRRWFGFFVLFLGSLTAVAWSSFHRYAGASDPWALRLWLLSLYLFYMSLCCTFFPAPTAWLVLLMASPVLALVQPGLLTELVALSPRAAQMTAAALTIVLVGAVGALGTTMANLNEYHVFTFLLRFGRGQRLRRWRFYQAASRWFHVSPFSLMTVINFLPVPVDVVRWLAISNRYRRDHFAAACFLGRFVRYGLFAATALYFQLEPWAIAAIQLAIIALMALRYLPALRRATAEPAAPALPATEGVHS